MTRKQRSGYNPIGHYNYRSEVIVDQAPTFGINKTWMSETMHTWGQISATRVIYHRASLGRLSIVTEEKLAQGYDGGDPRREP